MPERFDAMQSFLQNAGWGGATISSLANDASFRRYLRVQLNDRSAVLMDAPPSHEDIRPFIHIARHLKCLGLSAPDILAADEDHGFLLLEDFGNETFSRLLNDGEDETKLYRLAVDVLIYLHGLASQFAAPSGLPVYNESRLLDEALLLVDWYLPAVLDRSPGEHERNSYIEAWKSALPHVHVSPPTLVLRDYHVDNLIRLSSRDGIAACGLLDFQDAVLGSSAYDLMSLLEDARRDVSATLKREMLDRYMDAANVSDRRGFEEAFVILAAQRHAKVIGIFTRLRRRDGKSAYLAHIPRVWRLLENALSAAPLMPVAEWMEKHLPSSVRTVPE